MAGVTKTLGIIFVEGSATIFEGHDMVDMLRGQYLARPAYLIPREDKRSESLPLSGLIERIRWGNATRLLLFLRSILVSIAVAARAHCLAPGPSTDPFGFTRHRMQAP